MNLQYDFILNMLEFQTEEPQYGSNVTSVMISLLNMLEFQTEEPQYGINVTSE